jgi:hypothetical protein
MSLSTNTTGTNASRVRSPAPHPLPPFLLTLPPVMRACEGCRRRKIKCDAATTNAWPCAACIRLKLNCVPPTVSYDKDFNESSQTYEMESKSLDYAQPVAPSQHDYQRHSSMSHIMPHQMTPSLPTPVSGMYQTSPYSDQQSQDSMHYSAMSQPQSVQQSMSYQPQAYSQTSSAAPAMVMTPPESEPHWRSESVSSLSDVLGELKIDHTAIGKHVSELRFSSLVAKLCSAIYHEPEEGPGRNTRPGRVRSAAAPLRQPGPHHPYPPRDDALGRTSAAVL